MKQISTKVGASRHTAVPTLVDLSGSEALKPSSLPLTASPSPPTCLPSESLPLSSWHWVHLLLPLCCPDHMHSCCMWGTTSFQGGGVTQRPGIHWRGGVGVRALQEEERRGCSRWLGGRVSAGRKLESAASQLLSSSLFLQGHQVQEKQETTNQSCFTYGNLAIISF